MIQYLGQNEKIHSSETGQKANFYCWPKNLQIKIIKEYHYVKYFLPNTKINNDGVDMVDEVAAITFSWYVILMTTLTLDWDVELRCWSSGDS